MISNDSVAIEFHGTFHETPALIARAPGRINLIGEHTDYNGGFVLPAAIDFEIKMAARPSPDHRMHLWSVNYSESFDFEPVAPLPNPKKTEWHSYFLAVCDQFLQRGHTVPAMEIVMSGDVPLGAGLSSSAAFEVCAATLLNHVCHAGLDARELALLAQAAEHSSFVGVRCGIMDQFASALGAPASALLLDCYSLDYETVPFDTSAASIVIINSNKPRELRSSDYNQRRLECEEGLAKINEFSGQNYPSLRHIPMDVFEKHKGDLLPLVARRVRHNITENARVLEFVKTLRKNDWSAAGELLYASHASLRDDFQVSCDELDAIVEIARESGLAHGCRMTGGGFGGCAVALVAPAKAAEFEKYLVPRYKAKTDLEASIYVTQPAAGASLL